MANSFLGKPSAISAIIDFKDRPRNSRRERLFISAITRGRFGFVRIMAIGAIQVRVVRAGIDLREMCRFGNVFAVAKEAEIPAGGFSRFNRGGVFRVLEQGAVSGLAIDRFMFGLGPEGVC